MAEPLLTVWLALDAQRAIRTRDTFAELSATARHAFGTMADAIDYAYSAFFPSRRNFAAMLDHVAVSTEVAPWRNRHIHPDTAGPPPAAPLGYFWRRDPTRGRWFLFPG